MSADFNTRQWVLDSITGLLDPTWRFIPYEASLDNIGVTPVVMLHLESIDPHPAGPRLLDVTYKLTILEPKQDPGTRDQALDNKVIDLIEAINEAPGFVWTGAQSSLYRDTYISYVITLSAPINL